MPDVPGPEGAEAVADADGGAVSRLPVTRRPRHHVRRPQRVVVRRRRHVWRKELLRRCRRLRRVDGSAERVLGRDSSRVQVFFGRDGDLRAADGRRQVSDQDLFILGRVRGKPHQLVSLNDQVPARI